MHQILLKDSLNLQFCHACLFIKKMLVSRVGRYIDNSIVSLVSLCWANPVHSCLRDCDVTVKLDIYSLPSPPPSHFGRTCCGYQLAKVCQLFV